MVLQPHVEVPVLVVGGGPVGQLTAYQLAKNGTRCMLVEKNATTTSYPKMGYLNMRSMELLHRLGLDQKLRDIGVPSHYDLDVLFSTGLSEGGQALSKWELPSPDQKMNDMRKRNDGHELTQTYLRCSQVAFEALLREEIQKEPLIDSRWSTAFENLAEDFHGVTSHLTDADGNPVTVKSQYVVGCDGAGSRVRTQLPGRILRGDHLPARVYMVHFRSRDLSKLHSQGRFWHCFFTNSCALIAQDEKELWLVRAVFPADFDVDSLIPEQVIQRALGGSLAPTDVQIDEVIITGTWKPGMFIMENFVSQKGRVFLAGDAAHQHIPIGGFGLNTGIGDAFDLGWKLASVLAGHAGPRILQSYDAERRPVSARNTAVALEHWQTRITWWKWLEENPGLVTMDSTEGRAFRKLCDDHFRRFDHEYKDFGIETDYRYNGSPVIVPDLEVSEPQSNRSTYVPSTWPGSRAPALLLRNSAVNIHDLFGTGLEYTLFDFSKDGRYASVFAQSAREEHIPIRAVHFPDEQHARRIYERDAVLIRPDGHVAWRCNGAGDDVVDAGSVLGTAVGKLPVTTTVVQDASRLAQAANPPPTAIWNFEDRPYPGGRPDIGQTKQIHDYFDGKRCMVGAFETILANRWYRKARFLCQSY